MTGENDTMAKPKNAFLARQEARTRALCDEQRLFTIQQCCDVLLIAANRAFGFGPVRLHRLLVAYQNVFVEYATMALDDGADDPDIIYTRAKVDEALRRICGEWFRPWEERYG